ncbi:helix-turn-helix domain-containing protein [Paenibacillus sp. GCM10023252]|uniref:AraC family transcriptional regulator n=1 Tax=Paenibacillus sp. GCM10023252 TaxID=3252649 RepID=UPI003606AB57
MPPTDDLYSTLPITLAQVSGTYPGTIVYPPGGRYGPRIQQDLQLVLLHTGSLQLTINGERHTIKPGQAVLLTPGQQEYFAFSDEGDSWHRWITLHLAEPLDAKAEQLLQALPFSQPISVELNRLLDVLLTLMVNHEEGSAIMRSLGYAAFQLYASELHQTKRLEDTHPSIVMAKSRIHSHYAEELRLEELAHEAGVSPEHLVRLFRGKEGTTPIKYLWHYRVLRAVELLTNTGLSIAEIASRCGFKTTFHFARMVRRQTGSTPTELRRSSWEGKAKS